MCIKFSDKLLKVVSDSISDLFQKFPGGGGGGGGGGGHPPRRLVLRTLG